MKDTIQNTTAGRLLLAENSYLRNRVAQAGATIYMLTAAAGALLMINVALVGIMAVTIYTAFTHTACSGPGREVVTRVTPSQSRAPARDESRILPGAPRTTIIEKREKM